MSPAEGHTGGAMESEIQSMSTWLPCTLEVNWHFPSVAFIFSKLCASYKCSSPFSVATAIPQTRYFVKNKVSSVHFWSLQNWERVLSKVLLVSTPQGPQAAQSITYGKRDGSKLDFVTDSSEAKLPEWLCFRDLATPYLYHLVPTLLSHHGDHREFWWEHSSQSSRQYRLWNIWTFSL